MQHLDFIVWMIFFPLMVTIIELIDSFKLNKKNYSKETQASSGLFVFMIWIYIGYLLF